MAPQGILPSLCLLRPLTARTPPLSDSGFTPISGPTPLHSWKIWHPLPSMRDPSLASLLLLWGLPLAFTSDFQPSIVDLSSQPHVAWLAHWCPNPHGPSVWVWSVCVCLLILLEYSYFTVCFCCTAKWISDVFAYIPLFVDFRLL